jgi:hypothetical protein
LHHLRRRVVDGKLLDRREDRAGAIWTIQSGTCGTNATSGTKTGHVADARTHAPAPARETPGPTKNSPASPSSPADCPHAEIDETPTFDGYVNRRCRACQTDLSCRKA